MSTKNEAVLGFHVMSEASYYESIKNSINEVDKINIGRYYESGGCDYEISVDWGFLQNNLSLKINIYDDAMPFVNDVHEVLNAIKFACDSNEKGVPRVEDVKKELFKIGYKNLTN